MANIKSYSKKTTKLGCKLGLKMSVINVQKKMTCTIHVKNPNNVYPFIG